MKKIIDSIANFFKGLVALKGPEISLEDIVLDEWPNAEKIDPEIVWLDADFNDFKENASMYPEHYSVNVFMLSDIDIDDASIVYKEYLSIRGHIQVENEKELLLEEVLETNKKNSFPTRSHVTKDKNGILKFHQIVYRKIDSLLMVMSKDWAA